MAELLNRIVRRGLAMTDAAVTSILFLWDESQQRLYAKASYPDDAQLSSLSYVLGEGLVGRAAKQQVGILSEALAPDSIDAFSTPDGVQPKSALAEPLLCRDQLLGVLLLHNGLTNRLFTPKDQAMFELFAAETARVLKSEQLYEARELQLSCLQALTHLHNFVSNTADLDNVLQEVVRIAAALTGVSCVSLWLVNHETQYITPQVMSHPMLAASYPTQPQPLDRSAVGWVATYQSSLKVDNIFSDTRFVDTNWYQQNGLQSFFGFPVIYDELPLAVISLNHTQPIALNAETQNVLETLTFQTALILRNHNLQIAVSKRRQQTETLAGVWHFLLQSLDIKAVRQCIVDSVCSIFQAKIATISQYDPDTGCLQLLNKSSGAEFPDWQPEFILSPGDGVAGYAIQHRCLVDTPDLLADDRFTFSPQLRDYIEQLPFRSLLCVPLIVNDRLIGTFSVCDEQGRLFTSEERQLAHMFANQAAMALNNAELYEQVRSTRDFIKSIVANSADAIISTDISGKITFFSPAAEDIFGFSSQDCLGQPLAALLRQRNAEVKAIMRRLHREGRFGNYETEIQTKDGRWVEVDGSLSALLDDHGNAVGIIGIFKDITERKQAQKALLESEQRFRSVAQSAYDAIIAADRSGKIITWNEGGEKIFGYREEEVLGQPLTRLMPARYQSQHQQGLNRAAETKETSSGRGSYELTGLRKNGDEFPIELSLASWMVGDDIFFSGIIRDITSRKESEAKIREYNETLEQTVAERTDELQRAKEVAETASRTKSEFLANISHELRTPLHGILGYTELGVRRSTSAKPEKLQSYFEQIKESSSSLLFLLNDLLDLAKLESGQMKYTFEPVICNDLVSKIADEFHSLISERSLHLKLSLPEEPIDLVLDGIRIQQVVRNLLSNALKFSPENGAIELKLWRQPDSCAISVCDEGVGLPEDELDAVFGKFIQSSTTKTGAGGTGLGLAICREIVAAHGGSIWAENNPHGGARFTFTIPEQSLTSKPEADSESP